MIGIHPAQDASAAAEPSVLTGIVTGSDGRPAVGVTVALRNEGGTFSRRAYTDESGAFRFEDLVAYRYALHFSCGETCVGNYLPGYWSDQPDDQSKTWIDVGDGELVELQAELELAGEISGSVHGDDGVALEGAEVSITSVTPEIAPPQPFTLTDAEGRYRLRNLPEAGYTLRFSPVGSFYVEFFDEYWKDQGDAAAADVIQVTAGESVSGVDASLTPAAWISGRVVNEDGVPFGSFEDVNVFLYRVTEDGVSWVWTESLRGRGEFRFDGLKAGTYVLWTRTLAWGGLNGVGEWWHDQSDVASADPIVVTPGDRFDATIVLEGGPVDLTGPSIVGTPRVGETLSAGAATRTATATLAYQWTADGVPIDGATASTFAPGEAEIGKELAVKVAATAPDRISVTRTSSATSAVSAGILTAAAPTIVGDSVIGTTLTVETGEWSDGTELAYQWYSAGKPVSNDPTLELTSALAGEKVRVDVTGTKPGYTPTTMESAVVGPVVYGSVELDSVVILGNPAVGLTLTAEASSPTPGVSFHYRWWADGVPIPNEYRRTLTLDEDLHGALITVTVTAEAEHYRSASLASMEIGPVESEPWAEVSRLAGSDRYETSAALSRASIDAGVNTVLVASGADFPDALSSAGQVEDYGAPVLLSNPSSLPPSVMAELKRLGPRFIHILGGEGAVSAKVEAQLGALAEDVWRTAGVDRYETSALISRGISVGSGPVVYIASGQGFADALAGGPLAIMDGGPVLLSQPSALPGVIGEELKRLAPGRIVILGGPGAINESVASALGQYTSGSVERLSGADRYATSVAISQSRFEAGAETVYIASGMGFADALSGAAIAGLEGAPILLTAADSVPQSVLDEVERLHPKRIVILGGPGAVSTAVEAQLEALDE